MKRNKINIKIIVSVLVFAFVLPFIFTGIYSEAATVKSSLEENMSTYGFSADSENLTINITKSIDIYLNAGDANNRSNSTKTYPAGTYNVYKSVNGSINISRQKGQPGGWINVRDLSNAVVSVSDATPEPKSEVKNESTNTNSNSSSSKEEKIKISKGVKAYISADDAVNGTNSVVTYSAGEYFVYKSTSNAINITRVAGTPGAWVSNSSLTTESNQTPKQKETIKEVKKETPKQTSVTNTTTVTNNNGKIVVTGKISVHLNAADALSGKNAQGTWNAGTYEIYKTYGNAINITTEKGTPGGWIDGSKIVKKSTTPSVPSTQKQTETVKKQTNTSIVANGNKVILPTDSKVYTNAQDAMDAKNASATFEKGEYFIYKTYGNAINITKVKGQPGGWIAATVKEAVKSTPTPAPTPTKSGKQENSNTSTSNKVFVLSLDPGHGAGDAHNRGGLIFNEGDQNFIFTGLIMEEAKKYKDVSVKTTRLKNEDDPELEDRAKMASGGDLFVSIHSNAGAPSVRGVEAWGANENSIVGHNIAKELTTTWSSILNTPNRGVKYDYKSDKGFITTSSPNKGKEETWKVFKGNTSKEKILLESVFHTNIEDSKVYLKNQKLLAQKFMEIISKQFGLKLK